MTETCLMHNTLVVLSTGLGKTLIAAVAMYNFSGWFPDRKLVFMAPTRPLVAQQMEACRRYFEDVNPSCMVELTGAQLPSQREALWKSGRVFFLTPHVMLNDLVSGFCPDDQICLLVLDEAHRATGKYPYGEIIRWMEGKQRSFRIIGLTATPASSIGGVQQLLNTLQARRLEVRSESSPDVATFVHTRETNRIVVEPSPQLATILTWFQGQIMQPYVTQLQRLNGLPGGLTPADLTSFRLIKEKDAYRQRSLAAGPTPFSGAVEGQFAMLITLASLQEILSLHGIMPFYNMLLSGGTDDGHQRKRLLNEVQRNPAYQRLLAMIKEAGNEPDFLSHPKVGEAERILLEHFRSAASTSRDTRAIVFAQYRESVAELTRRFSRYAPLIKAISFVGQRGQSKAFTQKQQLQVSRSHFGFFIQLQVLKAFREGGYNVLVSTSIGEEGLDIGEVDLIICYDAQSSPLRYLQRLGRTGRQRDGRIVLLMCPGREVERFQEGRNIEAAMLRALEDPARHFRLAQTESLVIEGKLTCLQREFSLPVVATTKPKKAKAKGTRSDESSFLCSFGTITQGMIEKSANPRPSFQRQSCKTFRIGHSRVCQQYLSLLVTSPNETEDEDKEKATKSSQPPGTIESHQRLENMMSSWKRSFTMSDLDEFIELTLPLLRPRRQIGELSSVMPDELVVGEEDLPDDFFDLEEMETELRHIEESAAVVDPPIGLPSCRIEPPVQPVPLFVAGGVVTQSQTPMRIAKRVAPPQQVHSSSLAATPIRPLKKARREVVRHFFDTQADASSGMESEEEGIDSELTSFINDDDEEEEETENLESCDSQDNPVVDMTAFYRQSLLHSQPFGGFTTGSRFIRKPVKPSALVTLIEDSSNEDCTPESSQISSQPIQMAELVNADLEGINWDSDDFV